MLGLQNLRYGILRLMPFRLNLYLQLHVWKKDIYFGGMNDAQRDIAWKEFSELNSLPEAYVYGPPFEPPWVAFPDCSQGSMGFRMGAGEDYIMQFKKWYKAADNATIFRYKNKNPEPDDYQWFYQELDFHRADNQFN
ncbi:MAG: hypothetical protein ABJ275_12290 [Maricaulaceae bacterium]